MQAKPAYSFEQLLPLCIRTGLGILLLLIVRKVIISLPMQEEIVFPLKFQLADLFSAVILSIVLVLLLNFGVGMELRLRYLVPEFPQGGTMVKQIFLLIVVLTGYAAYLPLAIPYLGELSWLYHLLFLAVFLGVLGVLAGSIYSNLDGFINLFLKLVRAAKVGSSGEAVCQKCGEKSLSGAQFCSFCGESLPRTTCCAGCKAELKPGVKFCPYCGLAQSQ